MQDRAIRPAKGYREEEEEDNYDNSHNNQEEIAEEEKGDDGPSLDFDENEGVVGGQEPELEKEVENYMHRGEYQDAYNTLKKLEKLDNTKPETYLNMAKCQTELKLFIQSIKSLQFAVDLDPKHSSSNSSQKHYKDNKVILQNSNDI